MILNPIKLYENGKPCSSKLNNDVTPMFSLGIGGGAGIHYRFKNNSVLSLRLGLITGPSIEKGDFSMLTLPNFGVEYAFPLKRKNSGKEISFFNRTCCN